MGIHVPFDGVVMDRKVEEDKLEAYAKSRGVQFFNEFILNKIQINNDRISYVEVFVFFRFSFALEIYLSYPWF